MVAEVGSALVMGLVLDLQPETPSQPHHPGLRYLRAAILLHMAAQSQSQAIPRVISVFESFNIRLIARNSAHQKKCGVAR